ncbi:MarR family winged helix-turn-helix transcriptional regulator [uncultured Thomasclavelia sp.]|uniref:MarR family winged helix-turn-helix transcriptional regulator n=1 Tax=uncultured Thomasclavelia sp. TaxID=3025759 RepID=UPI0025F25A6F|nr:MarR family transcriptional regulator [uncultured Thomasclavelia sp.]
MKTLTLPIYEHILKYYNSLFEELQKKYQITQIEIDILAFLANNPQYHYAQEIVDIRRISKAHVSIGIEKLVKRGYLNRTPNPNNRRCNLLEITKEATVVIGEIQMIQSNYKKQLYQGIEEQEKELYDQILMKMYQNIGGKVSQ